MKQLSDLHTKWIMNAIIEVFDCEAETITCPVELVETLTMIKKRLAKPIVIEEVPEKCPDNPWSFVNGGTYLVRFDECHNVYRNKREWRVDTNAGYFSAGKPQTTTNWETTMLINWIMGHPTYAEQEHYNSRNGRTEVKLAKNLLEFASLMETGRTFILHAIASYLTPGVCTEEPHPILDPRVVVLIKEPEPAHE